MTKTQLPNPFEPDSDISKEFNSLLHELVADYEPSQGPDYFYRRTRKFTAAEVRAMKEKMQPYLDKGWLNSIRSQYAFDFMASLRAKDIDISSLVDAVELSISDADDRKHQYILFNHLSNLISAFVAQSQADELERFFALRADDLDRWQQLVLRKCVGQKWFREDPRFAYLATDERFQEDIRAKMLRGKK